MTVSGVSVTRSMPTRASRSSHDSVNPCRAWARSPTIVRLRDGQRRVELDDGRTSRATARRLGPSRLELAIHEGRKHQVKRMCEAVGHPVRRLHRREYAGLTLAGLEPGAWRELTAEEVVALRAAVG